MLSPIRLAASAMILLAWANVAHAADTTLAQAQLNLHFLGFDPGPFDGSWGGKTKTAFEQFYQGRGTEFDGEFSNNEVADLYRALSEVPFNGAGIEGLISAKDGRTGDDPAYDFVPFSDLSDELPPVSAIVPLDQFSARIRTASGKQRSDICNWSDENRLPLKGKALTTYGSFREFETTANRVPHPGNVWFDDLKFLVSMASERIAGNPDRKLRLDLSEALLRYSAAGVGLDSVHLLDKKTGKVIVTPDLATAVMASTSLTLNYLLVKPRLGYSAAQNAQVEQWLDRLFETFADSYVALNGEGHKLDPRGMELVGRATMANGILKNDAATFNRGAKMAATFISFVREDGSHRFGANRGFRALYYMGSALSMALEDALLIESQGLPARKVLMPNINKMAGFLARAYKDNSVLWPYAKENAAVTVGSNYKKQDELEPPIGLDMFFAFSPDDPSVEGLREWRAEYPYVAQPTESFNGTCMALGIAAPLDAYAVALANPDRDNGPVLTGGVVSVMLLDDLEDFSQFRISLGRAKYLNNAAIPSSFNIMADFANTPKTPENVKLLRIAIEASSLRDPISRSANYSECGELAMRPGGPNLHFGGESTLNQCVLEHMAPIDGDVWTAIMNSMPALVHSKAADSEVAATLDALIAVKPLPTADD